MKPVSETAFIRRLRHPMTRFLRDILRQPTELQKTLNYLFADGRSALQESSDLVRSARHVYLTGIGSSWHAALAAGALFHHNGLPVHQLDAAELLHGGRFPEDSVLVVISRSGRSAEIVGLLLKARRCGARVIGITNAADGCLATESQIPIVVPIALDHAISVNTYSTLAAAAGVLAGAATDSFDSPLLPSFAEALAGVKQALPRWQEEIEQSSWFSPQATHYFLGRGSSLGTCHEARLLWEEGAKRPATAMATSSFRHGPQEIVTRGMRFGLWIDGQRMREEDLAVARDLRQLGASVMLIGQRLPQGAADLVFELPPIDAAWQFVTEIIPAQLAAERLARLAGVDCDSFRLCSYIVEHEYGLLPEEIGAPKDEK
jgi:glutamine---fructose-6-phosphate transaminase (isomerizing)